MIARQEHTQIGVTIWRAVAQLSAEDPSVFLNCPKCSSTLAIDTLATRCCSGLIGRWSVGNAWYSDLAQDQRVIGVVARAAFSVASWARSEYNALPTPPTPISPLQHRVMPGIDGEGR